MILIFLCPCFFLFLFSGFEGVCSRILGALESLRELVSDNDDFPKRDTLVQLSFASLQTINSVCASQDPFPLSIAFRFHVTNLLSFIFRCFAR